MIFSAESLSFLLQWKVCSISLLLHLTHLIVRLGSAGASSARRGLRTGGERLALPARPAAYCQCLLIWNVFSRGVRRAAGAELLAASVSVSLAHKCFENN